MAALRHRHVTSADEFEDAQAVGCRPLDLGIAAGRGHAEQLDRRRAMRHDERDGIVVAGIAVEQDRGGGHAFGSRALVARHRVLEDRQEAAAVDAGADARRLRPAAGQDLAAAIGDRLAARDAPVEHHIDEKRLGHGAEVGCEGQRRGDHVIHREADQVEELPPDVDIDREDAVDHARRPDCRLRRRVMSARSSRVIMPVAARLSSQTSSGTRILSTSALSTMRDASGSAQILYSVTGVMLPGVENVPPSTTMRLSSRAELRLLQQGHAGIGQRTGGHQRDLAGSGARRVHNEVDGVPVDWLVGWAAAPCGLNSFSRSPKRASEPLLEMDRSLHVGLGIADDRPPGAGGDGNVLAAGQRQRVEHDIGHLLDAARRRR